MTSTTPPFAYFGGKTTIAQRIVDLLPAHRSYVEPFAGSLAVLLAKQPARIEVVNDIDNELMTFWRVLREQPTELVRVCALTPHSRAEYEASKSREGMADLELARRVWSNLAQGRSGTLRNTGWRHFVDPWGTNLSMGGYLAAYVDRMAAIVERLREVSLEARPALEIIAAYGQHRDVLIYADPPYLGSTRDGTNYAHEMASEAAHRDLADALHAARAAVVLSGYDSRLYSELYADWHPVRIRTRTTQGGANQSRVEVLWMNRPPHENDLFADEAGGGS